MEYTDTFGQTAKLEIPAGVKNIAVSMSGGADSSLLCYLLAKQIKEQNLDIKIFPISAIFAVRPWSYETAIKVVKTIEQLTGFTNWGHHWKFRVSLEDCKLDSAKEKRFGDVMSLLFSNQIIDHLYSGKTKNPSQLVCDTFVDKRRQHDRDAPTEADIYKADVETVPWAMVDKRFVLDIYKQHNLLNTLLPLTRSCEGDVVQTENFTKICNTCWWCEERAWALKQIA